MAKARVEESILLAEMRNVPIQAATIPSADDTDNRTRRERVELERLRREAATLRARIAELTAQVQGLSAANPSQKISGTPIGETLNLSELRDAGQATPAMLLQTQMWATLHSDTNRLAQIMAFDPETDMLIVQRMFDEMHRDAVKGMDAVLAEAPLSEIRLLEEQPAENNDRWIVSEFVKKNGDIGGRARVRVRLTDVGWKLVIGIDGQNRHRIRRCSEREPAVSLRDKSNLIGGWLPSLTFFVRPPAHYESTTRDRSLCGLVGPDPSRFRARIRQS